LNKREASQKLDGEQSEIGLNCKLGGWGAAAAWLSS
jgi:hypothetical protein